MLGIVLLPAPSVLAQSRSPDCLPNVIKCVDQGVEVFKRGNERIGEMLDPRDSMANTMLAPIADGISIVTNQMIRVILVEWLYQPSIRLTDSGVFLEQNPDFPEGGAGVGCLTYYAYNQPGSSPSPSSPPSPSPSLPSGSPSPTHSPAPDEQTPQNPCLDPNRSGASATSKISTAKVQGIMLGIGAIIATFLLIFQGIRTAISRKGAPLIGAIQGLLIMAIHVVLSVAALDALLVASDIVTKEIIDSSLGEDLGTRMFAVLSLSTASFGPVATILFGIILFLIGVFQLITLFFRQAAIPVLALLFPIASAGQVGGSLSQQWLIRLWTTLFAIVLYKPAAALIFAVGFLEIGEGRGPWDIVRGFVTLILAIIALPTLMRLFTPIVGQTVGAGFEGGLGKIVSTVGGVVEGAAHATTLIGGGGAGGGKKNGSSAGSNSSVAPADPPSYEGSPPQKDASAPTTIPDLQLGNASGRRNNSSPKTNNPSPEDDPITFNELAWLDLLRSLLAPPNDPPGKGPPPDDD